MLPNVMLTNLQKFTELYGSLYEIKLFNKRIVVISDKNILREVLTKRPKIFRRAISLDHAAKSFDFETGLFHASGKPFVPPPTS